MKRSRINQKRDRPRRLRHPMSTLAEDQPDDHDDERAAYERCHRRKGCEAKVAEGCRDRNEHAHHRQMRSQGGPTNDVNLLAVCNACHTWIHGHPEKSYEAGLLVPSWSDPVEWPVKR